MEYIQQDPSISYAHPKETVLKFRRELQSSLDFSIPEVTLAQQSFWLRTVLFFVVVFNIIDALFTNFWIETKQATELNPLMAYLLDWHPSLFFICKISMVTVGCFLLWKLRRRKLAVVSGVGVFLVYFAIVIYHLLAYSFLIELS